MSKVRFLFYKILFGIVTCLSSVAYGQEEVSKEQEKIEIEKAIQLEDVPQISSDFVLKLFPETKVDWYLDISGTDSTFEAKLKSGGRRYSIEFNKDGSILDGEVQINERELPGFVSDTIQGFLKNDFVKFELKKIQKQYNEKVDIMKAVMDGDSENLEQKLNIKYEIVVFGVKGDEQVYYEYLFDSDGIFIKRLKLEQTNNDNLFY